MAIHLPAHRWFEVDCIVALSGRRILAASYADFMTITAPPSTAGAHPVCRPYARRIWPRAL
jgi:hypothetical protein